MKTILTFLALIISFSGFCQMREYTYENVGINIFLEAQGGGNRSYGLGGPTFTIGYQFNPHIFFGGGVSFVIGNGRGSMYDDYKEIGWYDSKTNAYYSDYYCDENGEYHKVKSRYSDEDDCGGLFGDGFNDFFADFRYNVLAHKRYTPYLNLRAGLFYGSYDTSFFDEVLIGCRFGCGEGDFAIVGGAGYSFRRILDKGYSDKHLFDIRLGVEF